MSYVNKQIQKCTKVNFSIMALNVWSHLTARALKVRNTREPTVEKLALIGRIKASESYSWYIATGLTHSIFTTFLESVLLCDARLHIIAFEYLQVIHNSISDANAV